MERERVLIALGGNALSKTGKDSFARQMLQSKAIARAIAKAAQEYEIILTHGNGPQVGNHLIRNELSKEQATPMPLDACVADTQGEIGYMLQQTISNELGRLGLHSTVATVITQVLVEANDPAFQNPTKPVGPFLQKEEADRLGRKGYTFSEDSRGRGFRRTVPSPKPTHILELETIRSLVENRVTTIACGGGGIPVVKAGGFYVGVEAVIDKDLSSSLLARELGVSKFIILTDTDNVYLDFNKPTQKKLLKLGFQEARRYLSEGQFPDGSMGPKIMAATEFLKSTGREAYIGSVDRVLEILKGESGTCISH
ncbi:MAG: carbamate kinase [Candidatus Micrarchaeota archaeon]